MRLSKDSQFFALPINFRRLSHSTQDTLITNLTGQFAYIKENEEFNNLMRENFTALSYNTINELIAKGFIATEEEKQIRLNLTASKLAHKVKENLCSPSLFLIVPTLRCDHSCTYCQVSRVPENKSGYDLDKNYVKQIIQIIKKTKSEEIKIEFQGGEPLLAIDFIYDFLQEASIELSNKNVQYVICTSLTKNVDQIIPIAKKYNIYFSVSLDGNESIHNYNRTNRNYNSYIEMKKNIDIISEELGHDRVSCLSTITKSSLENPKDIVDSYLNLGFRGIFLRPLSPYGFARNKANRIGYEIHEFLSFYKEALSYIFEINKKQSFIEETTLIHLKKIFRESQNTYVDLKSPSGHLLGAMLFNYDGNIFGSDEARMLWQETKNENLALGHVKNFSIEGLIESSLNLLSDTFLFSNPGCDDCAYNQYCGSDPMFHLSTQGDHIGNKAFSDFCKLEKGIFDHIFSIFQRDSYERGVLQEWLNH